jgi:4-amino-4-deoxy-L-arabinose transferase-like glycosyltransferase
MTLKKARVIFFVFLFLLTAALSFVPGHNGDMPYYIAAVFERQGLRESEALSAAKTTIGTEMEPAESRSHIYNLNNAEKNILEYYRIKPLYVLCIYLLHQIGFSFINATLLPSLISFIFIGFIVFAWAAKFFKPTPACIFSMILMLMNPSIILARLSSPDPMSNLLIFICLYRIYFQKRYYWTVVLLFVSLFVRLDNFIAVMVLLSLMFLWPEKKAPVKIPFSVFFVYILVTIVICIWVNFYFENNFWWFKRVRYIQSPLAYGYQVLVYCLSVSQSFLPPLILFGLLAYFYHKSSFDKKIIGMLGAIACIIFFRFLLFPSFEERFFTAFYLCGFLLILDLLRRDETVDNVKWRRTEEKDTFRPIN